MKRKKLSDITEGMLAKVPDKDWLTTQDIMDIFGIHRVTVNTWIKKGYLARHRGHGRANLYNRDEVIEYIISDYEPKPID